MRKLLALVLVASLPVFASVTAYWTGKVRNVTTVGGSYGVSCEYDAFGQKFWRTFKGNLCPSSVEAD